MRTLIIFILTIASWSMAAQPLIRYSVPDYPSNFTRANRILQGHDGKIWIGSSIGILMYDGKRCHKLNDYTLDISAMAIENDSLWAGTSSGHIALIDLKGGILLDYKHITEYGINHIDKKGKMLAIATDGDGLILANHIDTLRINNSTRLTDNVTYQSIWDTENRRIAIATDRGTEIFEIDNLKTNPVIKAKYADATLSTSLIYFKNKLLIGTFKNGIYEAANDQLNKFGESDELTGMSSMHSTEDEVYILDESGIWRISENNSLIPKSIISATDIADFTIIDEGLLLALHSNGKITTADLRLSSLGETFTNPITAIGEHNDIIYASSPGYVYELNADSGNLIKTCILPNNALATQIIADINQLYIGTFNEGLLIVNSATCAITQLNSKTGLPDDNILDLSLYNDTLWMVSLGGLTSIDMSGKVKKYPTSEVIGSTYIYSVFAGSNGILLGTDGNGLLAYNSGGFSRVSPESLLSQSTVYNISSDGNGNIWFNTKAGTIYRIEEGNFTTNSATSVTTASGRLMLSGSYGNGAVVIGSDYLRIIHNNADLPIYSSAGFESLSGEYIHNIALGKHGMLFFASDKSLYSLSDKNIKRYEPAVHIREIKVNLKSVSYGKTVYKSDENHVAFYFSGVWYQNPEILTFRYRINGGEWNTTEANEAVFSNLGYGDYSFELQVGLKGTFCEKSTLEYSFSILKPAYLQFWFIALSIAMLTLLIATVIHFRIRSLNRSRMAEQILLQSQLSALRTQVNPHFLFNSFNTLLNLIENDPEQASDYLQKMSEFYRKMLDDDKRQVITLREELDNFNAYFFLQQKRFGDAISANVEIEMGLLNTYIPVLTLQLLAENAIKHNTATRSKPLGIKIFTDGGSLIFSNEIIAKKNSEPGTGTGLKNIADRYYALFQAKIAIENDGVQFIVKLPLIDQADARTDI